MKYLNQEGYHNNKKRKMEQIEDKPIICIREVNENIRRVKLGEPLTRSLRVLNTNCEFKKKWEEIFDLTHKILRCSYCHKEIEQKGYCSEKCRKKYREYHKEYYQRPEVKKKVKKRLREYNQRPEVKERKRKYYQRPEAKKKNREYHKEYYQRPEVKKREREKKRESQRKRLKIPKSRWRVK